MTGSNRLEAWAEALEREGPSSFEEFLADEFFTHVPGPDEPGACARLLPIVRDIAAAMPDLRITLSDVDESDDPITASMTMRGTHEAPLWGAPASGASFEWTVAVSFRPVGDRFALRFDDVEFPVIVDRMRLLGLMPSPDKMDSPMPAPVSFPDFLLKLVFTGRAADKDCVHLADVKVVEPETRTCHQCVAEGAIWPALRMCLTCGFVGCCDTSKNKHAMGHHEETGHPLVRSIRMDEGWVWCYEDSAFFESRILDRLG